MVVVLFYYVYGGTAYMNELLLPGRAILRVRPVGVLELYRFDRTIQIHLLDIPVCQQLPDERLKLFSVHAAVEIRLALI